MNLLIVDDTPINLKLLRAQLESEGHAVFEAHNGVDALALLERQRMDVVISDIFMPEMDGYRLCYEIRKHARLHDLPIILCTSTYTSPDDEKLVRDVGADKYLKRPVSRETIVAALHEVLAMPHAAPQPKALQEVEVLKEYSERLVSKLEEKNNELMAAEVKFRSLVEQSIVGIFIAQDDQYVYVNPWMTKIFGRSEAEMTSRTLYDFIVPEDHALARENIRKRISGEVPGSRSYLRMLHQSGAVLQVEVHGSRADYNGRPAVMGMMLDITERKRAEERLRQSEQRFRTIFEAEPECVKVLGLKGNLLEMNAAGLAMLEAGSVDEVKSRSLVKFILPEYRAAFGALHQRVLGGKRGLLEFEVIGLRGTRRWLETHAAPMRDADGRVTMMLGVTRDITERKLAEAARVSLQAQLRESQKMEAIGTLAGGIAHDFNNILATILGNAELARQDVSTNPLALESLEEIRKAGSRARDLVQQILSFSRRQPTERKLIALAPVVDESVRLLRATLPARLTLNVHCEADVPLVLADATQIGQVVINLCTNAMQANHSGPGRIGIRLDTVMLDAAMAASHAALHALHEAHPGRTVRLAVSDDGPGMDAATFGRIFEPFFTTKAVGEGTGLGLSVVHGIVQTHEGAIEVNNEPGKGSAFTIYLPVAEAQSGAQAPDQSASATAPALSVDGGQHILYIDDDESLVFLVQRLLERRGYRISGYTNQHEALAALRVDPAAFDLVVTDHNMPGMSGLDVAREVRAIRADLPVAVASGFIDETLRAQAEGAGVQELIFKANAVEDLCDAFVRLAQAVQRKK